MAKIKITYTRSTIRAIERHKRTIRALGFRRLSQSVIREDTPSIRGMVNSVKHLVTVELAD